MINEKSKTNEEKKKISSSVIEGSGQFRCQTQHPPTIHRPSKEGKLFKENKKNMRGRGSSVHHLYLLAVANIVVAIITCCLLLFQLTLPSKKGERGDYSSTLTLDLSNMNPAGNQPHSYLRSQDRALTHFFSHLFFLEAATNKALGSKQWCQQH